MLSARLGLMSCIARLQLPPRLHIFQFNSFGRLNPSLRPIFLVKEGVISRRLIVSLRVCCLLFFGYWLPRTWASTEQHIPFINLRYGRWNKVHASESIEMSLPSSISKLVSSHPFYFPSVNIAVKTLPDLFEYVFRRSTSDLWTRNRFYSPVRCRRNSIPSQPGSSGLERFRFSGDG